MKRLSRALEAQAAAWRAWAAGVEARASQEEAEVEAQAAQARAWEAEAEAFAQAAQAAKERGAAWKMKARRAEARRKWAAERDEYLREHVVPIRQSRALHAREHSAKEYRERARALEAEARQPAAGGKVWRLSHYVSQRIVAARQERQLAITFFWEAGDFARALHAEAAFRAEFAEWDAQKAQKKVQEAQEAQAYAEVEAAREGITGAEVQAWERAVRGRKAEAVAWQAWARAAEAETWAWARAAEAEAQA